MNARSCRRCWPVLLVLSLLLAAPGALAMPKPPDLPAASPPFALYVTPFLGTGYTSINPATLADLPGAPPVTFTGVAPQLIPSADGSTVVTIRRPNDGPATVEVQAGINGPEQSHFAVGMSAGMALLSRDGARLAIATYLTNGEQEWRVFDTRSGRLLADVLTHGQPAGPPADILSPDGLILYHPFYDRPATPTTSETANQNAPKGPLPLRIAAYDLTTGKETGKVAVPIVFAGTWLNDPSASDPVAEIVQPAIALAPDGTRLAVVDAAGTRVTLLDARTLRVTGSHALHQPESAAHRFLRWLGLAPRVAEAKFMVGDQLSAVFAPDGQHLYLTGTETSVNAAKNAATGKALGVRRIDVNTGAITASGLSGSQVNTIIPAPDGRWLYVSGPTAPWWTSQSGQETWVVRRLDAQTLKPLAERVMPASSALTLVLVPANSQ